MSNWKEEALNIITGLTVLTWVVGGMALLIAAMHTPIGPVIGTIIVAGGVLFLAWLVGLLVQEIREEYKR